MGQRRRIIHALSLIGMQAIRATIGSCTSHFAGLTVDPARDDRNDGTAATQKGRGRGL